MSAYDVILPSFGLKYCPSSSLPLSCTLAVVVTSWSKNLAGGDDVSVSSSSCIFEEFTHSDCWSGLNPGLLFLLLRICCQEEDKAISHIVWTRLKGRLFSPFSCTCDLLASCTFHTLSFIGTKRHNVWACCKFAGDIWSNVEQGFSSRLPVVSRRTLHQRSSAVGPPPLLRACASSLFYSSPSLPVAWLSVPHAVWWKANQEEKEDPDMAIKCYTSPLIFLLSKPVK